MSDDLYCERCEANFNEYQRPRHDHPNALSLMELHDALIIKGYSDDFAWSIVDAVFSVSIWDIGRWQE